MEWTWAGMRGDAADRDWSRRSDVSAAIAACGLRLTDGQVERCLTQAITEIGKPERRYGHYRYRQDHVRAAIAAARRLYDRCMVGGDGDGGDGERVSAEG